MSALGTELKINVHVEPIGGIRMSEYDFTCMFYVYKNKVLEVKKQEMVKVDTSKIGVGYWVN